jgi:processive 1,2-diacylglycerol beta-glucosyltransferase
VTAETHIRSLSEIVAPMSKRILVLSASVGAGHLRAAQAVELALRELDPSAHVENHDVMKFTNGVSRRMYATSYLDLVNKVPHVLGYFYDLMDRPPSPQHKSDRLRRLVEKLNLRKFLKFLRAEPWDVVVNTHFLPAEMIAHLKRKGEFTSPQFTVTTDFETHRLWVNQPCEKYFTATEEGAAYLVHWGIPPETIEVTGIPIHPAFSRLPSRDECLTKHGLLGDRPMLLQLGGGFGVGPVEKIFRTLLAIDVPLEIVVVAGRNEALREQLPKIEVPSQHRAHVIGFTDVIHELMAVADLVVSKPGGLTTSETLASGAAMVVVNPIPGQESRNSDFLLEHGAAIKVNNTATLGHKLTELLRQPERLAKLKESARRLGKPSAAFEVARRALEIKTS